MRSKHQTAREAYARGYIGDLSAYYADGRPSKNSVQGGCAFVADIKRFRQTLYLKLLVTLPYISHIDLVLGT